MLRAVLTWWVQQLRSLLPARWRDPDARSPDGLILDCGALNGPPAPIALRQRRRGKERPAGATPSPPGTANQILRVAGSPLQREIVLPTSVEADIANILANDMGRLAPFSPADILWDWRIVRRDPARKRLTVQLWYVPRKALKPLLARLASLQLSPASLELVAAGGQVHRLALRPRPPRRHFGRWAAAGGSLLLAATITVAFALQSRQQEALAQQLAELRPHVQRVEQLRQRLVPQEPAAAVHAAEARRVGDALEVLAALTNALPDDTVLTDIALREHRLSLTGTSGEAAGLIAALSEFPLIRDPVFAAPIIRDPATLRDSFSLHAALAP